MRKHTKLTPLTAVNWKCLGGFTGLFMATMVVHTALYKNCPYCLYEWLFAIFICPVLGLLLAVQFYFDFKAIDKEIDREFAPRLAALKAKKQIYYQQKVVKMPSAEVIEKIEINGKDKSTKTDYPMREVSLEGIHQSI